MMQKLILILTTAALLGCATSSNDVSRYGFATISPKREMLANCLNKYGIQYRKKTGKELVYINGYSVFDYCKVLVDNIDFGIAG
tara:strand:- start:36012 stop:36263 length:252 start_codon:yes stop_codon:yes gene_type:complete